MLMLGLLVKVFLHEACQNRIRLLSSLSSSLSLSSSFTNTRSHARTLSPTLSLRIPEIWLTVWNHRCQSSRLCTLYQFVYKLLYCHSLMRPSRMLWGENTAAIFIFIFMTHCPFPASNSFIFLQPGLSLALLGDAGICDDQGFAVSQFCPWIQTRPARTESRHYTASGIIELKRDQMFS